MAITNNTDVSTTLAQYKALYVNGDDSKVDSLDEAKAIIKFAEKDDYKLIKQDKNVEVANALLEAYDFVIKNINKIKPDNDCWQNGLIKVAFGLSKDNVMKMLFPHKQQETTDKYRLDDSNARTIKQ